MKVTTADPIREPEGCQPHPHQPITPDIEHYYPHDTIWTISIESIKNRIITCKDLSAEIKEMPITATYLGTVPGWHCEDGDSVYGIAFNFVSREHVTRFIRVLHDAIDNADMSATYFRSRITPFADPNIYDLMVSYKRGLDDISEENVQLVDGHLRLLIRGRMIRRLTIIEFGDMMTEGHDTFMKYYNALYEGIKNAKKMDEFPSGFPYTT